MGKHHSYHPHEMNGYGDGAAGALERGVGRGRRRLSRQARDAIVAESFADGAEISAVARRHGIRPQQLFSWRWAERTKLRAERVSRTERPDPPPLFVPAFVGAPLAAGPSPAATDRVAIEPVSVATKPDDTNPIGAPSIHTATASTNTINSGSIEIALGGAVIRVHGAIDSQALHAVLMAVRGAS